jgi:hypothetical protein
MSRLISRLFSSGLRVETENMNFETETQMEAFETIMDVTGQICPREETL